MFLTRLDTNDHTLKYTDTLVYVLRSTINIFQYDFTKNNV